MRILIVEDEYTLAELILNRLKHENYSVDVSYDGEEGLYNALTDIYDLIVLDIMLPKINGIEILKELKNNNVKAKIIMLTAKSELEDKLLGFQAGAIDYITKPFHMDELIARINAHLRMESVRENNTIEFGDLSLNIKTSVLKCTNTCEEISIINKEFQLLEFFMNNSKQIISKEQIYDKIWGINNESFSNNLEAYLSFIRKKLKLIGSTVTIKSVRNLGYKMECLNEEVKK